MIVTKEEEPLILSSKIKIDFGVVRYRYVISSKQDGDLRTGTTVSSAVARETTNAAQINTIDFMNTILIVK